MKKRRLTALLLTAFFLIATPPARPEEHQPDHAHAEEGEGHEEKATKAGPGKGITEQGPLGFRLSPEAAKTIAFRTEPYVAGMTVPCPAIVSVRADKFLFRSRDGWLKREPVEVSSKNSGRCAVRAAALQPGDLVVVDQTGFLRIAEVFLEEDASHSHAH